MSALHAQLQCYKYERDVVESVLKGKDPDNGWGRGKEGMCREKR